MVGLSVFQMFWYCVVFLSSRVWSVGQWSVWCVHDEWWDCSLRAEDLWLFNALWKSNSILFTPAWLSRWEKWNVTFQINLYICITLNWSDRPEDIDTMKEDTQRGESFQNKRGDKYVLFVSTSTWLAWPEDIYIKEEWKEIAVVFRFKKMIISWWPQIIMPTRWKYISAYVPSKTGLRWEYGGCLHFQTEVFCLHFPAQLDLKIFIERWNKKMIISRAGCTDNKVKIFWCLITEDSEFS